MERAGARATGLRRGSGVTSMDGKNERSIWAGAQESKRGQRTSFNGADGISDIEGKVAGVATSKLGNERVSNSTSANSTLVYIGVRLSQGVRPCCRIEIG